MRIVTLEPFLAELVASLGLGEQLVAQAAGGRPGAAAEGVPIVTQPGAEVPAPADSAVSSTVSSTVKDAVIDDRSFCSAPVNLNALAALEVDVMLLSLACAAEDVPAKLAAWQEELSTSLGRSLKLYSYRPRTLEEIYEMLLQLGRDLGCPAEGLKLSQKLKAQFMDWADNFYERMHKKRVSFIAGMEPLRLGGWWIPDMIRLCSAEPQFWQVAQPGPEMEWVELLDFRPDVILVAPERQDIMEARRSFFHFSQLPYFGDIPAVKRGEVYFTGGREFFFQPSMNLIPSMAVLISAIAGFDSGYITPRESFFKLRWLELQRHRL